MVATFPFPPRSGGDRASPSGSPEARRRLRRIFRRLGRERIKYRRSASARDPMPSRPYKDLVIYGCFVLNRLVAGMGIELYQDGLESKLDRLLPGQPGMSREEVTREINSNHFMTDRAIETWEKGGQVTIKQFARRYCTRITRAGLLHIRNYYLPYLKLSQ